MWIACDDKLPEPNTVVLTTCGATWAVAKWTSKVWRVGTKQATVTHWTRIPPTSPPNRAKRCLPPANKLTLVGAGPDGMTPHIAFRDDEGPPSVWKRRPPSGPDEVLEGVIYWTPLPRLPSDKRGGLDV